VTIDSWHVYGSDAGLIRTIWVNVAAVWRSKNGTSWGRGCPTPALCMRCMQLC